MRQWLGYQRFDDPRLVDWLNAFYTTEWQRLQNFFWPSVKLLEKQRGGSKVIKVHDVPKTPVQRVLESEAVPEATKQQLRTQAASAFKPGVPAERQEVFASSHQQLHTPF